MHKSEWQEQVGDSWAAQWRRTDRSFTHLTERLLAATRGLATGQVLDIGCGAGELALAIARGNPQAQVLGVDISPQLVAAARMRGENLANVDFECADAAIWASQEGFAPGLLVSRHGVMFFDDPQAAFANLAALAAPGAHLLFSCFANPARNPFFTQVQKLLPPPAQAPDPHAPGPFAFADSDRVAAILAAGGWSNIAFEEVAFPMIAGVGDNAIEEALAYFTVIGPAARALRELETASADNIRENIRELATRNCRDGLVSLTATAWIVTARKG